MAFFASDTVLDSLLTYIRTNSTKIALLTAAPANLAACTASTVISVTTISTANISLISNDTTNTGRKIEISGLTGLTVQTTGEPSHYALFSTVGTTGLHFYGQLTTGTIANTTSNDINLSTFTITVQDPTS